jgi:hypothetical protein
MNHWLYLGELLIVLVVGAALAWIVFRWLVRLAMRH